MCRETAPSTIILIGFMGAGKTSVGRALAAKLGWMFEDLDDRIERRERRAVPEIFRDFGEAAFRQAEHSALKELLGEADIRHGKIVALGGGAFVQNDNFRLIESAGFSTIFLDAPVDELWRRCSGQQTVSRPLLGDLESFRNLYQGRRPLYLQASFTQQTAGKNPSQIADEIIHTLDHEHKSPKRGANH